ncbi:NADPH-dependent F420 reductase [Amycolatopsis jiangsuensis]|uniref:Putative dinucleotide-binding enzyme n=1 Tax=Amycolatopsis jiangsuensis TaxID=1181879 RepID=A0A840IZH1_9PSEU|nr:NAD(P)-binding domain-containing protein [Amycolatopsis jiangsuensis]MBB4686274.1 putative dinucleotide-binding enzyme [Amycolatopsis jiangsuensis]
MRIAIFGTGGMAAALGSRWTRHDLTVSGRDRGRTAKLAAELGAEVKSWADAAREADAVLLAVPSSALDELLPSLNLSGTVLLDCTNTPGDAEPPGTPVATRIAGHVPGASVVKAFNLAHVDVWRMAPPTFEGRPLGVPLCGDPAAVEVAAELVRDVGATPLPAGGLDRAPLLEATAAFAIGLWKRGADARTMLMS